MCPSTWRGHPYLTRMASLLILLYSGREVWHVYDQFGRGPGLPVLPGGSGNKESASSAGDVGSIPGLERSPGEGSSYPHQHSCLQNFHGLRSLVGYSPWGCKELDKTEWTLACLQGVCTLNYYFYAENSKEQAMSIKERMDWRQSREEACVWGNVISGTPVRAAWVSTLRNKAGRKYEGTWYISGEALGGQTMCFQTSVCKEFWSWYFIEAYMEPLIWFFINV